MNKFDQSDQFQSLSGRRAQNYKTPVWGIGAADRKPEKGKAFAPITMFISEDYCQLC